MDKLLPPLGFPRGDDGGRGEEGGRGGERCEDGTRSVCLLSALAHALQPHDRLPGRRPVHRHQGGRERDRGSSLVLTATGTNRKLPLPLMQNAR